MVVKRVSGAILWAGTGLVCTLGVARARAPQVASARGARDVTWSVADVTFLYKPRDRSLTVSREGLTFAPLYLSGPILLSADGEEVLPEGQQVDFLWEESTGDGSSRCRYRASAGGRSAEFVLDVSARAARDTGVPELRFQWWSGDACWGGITSGVVSGLRSWRRLFFTRAAEAYGHQFYPVTIYTADPPLWIHAEWDVSAGNLSGFRDREPSRAEETNPNFSVDPQEGTPARDSEHLRVVPQAVYRPNTNGDRLPLDDVLVVRFGSTLWDAVPVPPMQPSPYRDEMGRSVFVDCWGLSRAQEWAYRLELMGRLCGPGLKLYTVLQNWQAGGFDTLLPDSVWMPDYPPSPAAGTPDQLRELCRVGRRYGRIAFRTNYISLKSASPSAQRGLARRARTPSGEDRAFTRPSDLVNLAYRQEPEIRGLFLPNASFSDQLGSAGMADAFIDFDAAGGGGSLRETWARIKAACAYLRAVHSGPLGTETLNSDYLIGQWVDAGDFGVFAGHTRGLTPDYKLRRLHHLTGFHGMGLGYRFFHVPPYGGTNKINEGHRMYFSEGEEADDYRACQILFGNGAYLYYTAGMRWEHVLREILLVGRLQRHYAGVPVAAVEYHDPDTGRWLTLEQLVVAGVNVTPVRWVPQPEHLLRVRVTYANGLRVVVNRHREPLPVTCGPHAPALPTAGWCAHLTDGSLTAFSAPWKGTKNRIDFLEDKRTDERFLDPRGSSTADVAHPTYWRDGHVVAELLNGGKSLRVDGIELPCEVSMPPPPPRLRTDFSNGLGGWVATRDLVPFGIEDGVLRGVTVGPDPIMLSPHIRLPAATVSEIVVTMHSSDQGTGRIFWTTETIPAMTGQASVPFTVPASEGLVDIRIKVGDHPRWKGETITRVRVDPISTVEGATVEIRSIAAVP